MSQPEITQTRKVPVRTIIAAIAMFAGIILMGIGYFVNGQVMIYVGMAITLVGVLTEGVLGIIGGTRGHR